MKKFKELMTPAPDFVLKEVSEWLELNKNLARALEYKGVDDNENILSFDEDYELENSDMDYDTFKKECCPKFTKVIQYFKPEFSGGLNLTLGLLEDGSKVIYYVGGLISGYIARKEWLTTNTFEIEPGMCKVCHTGGIDDLVDGICSECIERLEEFKSYWLDRYSHIETVLTDGEIHKRITDSITIEMAVDLAVDYVVSQGLADVQE